MSTPLERLPRQLAAAVVGTALLRLCIGAEFNERILPSLLGLFIVVSSIDNFANEK